MAYNFFIALHIVGACATGVMALYTSFVLLRHVDEKYRACAIALGSFVTFNILSGIVLSVLSENITAVSVCKNLIVYLLVIFFMETLLFARMKKMPMLFPLRLVVSPVAMSLMLMTVAVSYGF